MNRREFVKVLGWGACVAVAKSGWAMGRKVPSKPNVILCMADDQGWGDMGYNGHPVLKTPNFDAMASEGVRFDHFYSAAPVCSPTRGSCMTGRHPNRFGCFSWGYPLRPQEITVAKALKSAGYATGHFGKWHLGSVCKGSPVNPGASGFDEWFSSPNFFDVDAVLSREGTAVQTHGESSMVTVDAALEFIRDKAEHKQPFLAVVWFGSPHDPYVALDEDKALYPDERPQLRSYYGEITAMDRAFGKLRNELGSLGIRDNTILWYCSDNGGVSKVSVTGGRKGKGSIYEGGLRVPALLEWPAAFPEPFVTDLPSCTSDFYPSLLDSAGVRIKGQPPLDGISLLPLLRKGSAKRPRPMGFWDYAAKGIRTPSKEWMAEMLQKQMAGQDETDPTRLLMDAAVIEKQYSEEDYPGHAAWNDGNWKLHRITDKSGSITWELYNLREDPEEQRDVLPNNARRVKRMQRELHQWLASVTRSLNGKDY
ncbi:MAG TPA: sulfatase-like hydrolase/transferase [bacterium]|nr:sulfatase-like hydrolase/transferase [bacterium]